MKVLLKIEHEEPFVVLLEDVLNGELSEGEPHIRNRLERDEAYHGTTRGGLRFIISAAPAAGGEAFGDVAHSPGARIACRTR